LRTEDAQLINSIFFEEAVGTRAIVFKTNLALQRAIEGYLKLDVPGFKISFTIFNLMTLICPWAVRA
jgi:hypothetical protein